MFLKDFFLKVNFEKNLSDNNRSMKIYPAFRVTLYSRDVNIRALSSLDISEPTGFSMQRGNTGLLQKIGEQGSHRLEKYLNIHDCLEKSLTIKFALKST